MSTARKMTRAKITDHARGRLAAPTYAPILCLVH